MQKIKVGKLKIGSPLLWFADCPCCPAHLGFYTGESWRLAYMWADIHGGLHKTREDLVCVEKRVADRG